MPPDVDVPLRRAAEAIAAGRVIAIPTDTVYGLACDPASAAAVERIYSIKRRPAELELTLLGASFEAFSELVFMPEAVAAVARRHWPGPLSIVLPVGPRRLAVPRAAGTLAVRVPDHPLLLRLLSLTGPLATTSANRHGEPAAVDAEAARRSLGAEVALVLDGGRGRGLASTIIDCAATPYRCLREGPVGWSELEPHLSESVARRAGEEPA